MGLGGMGIGGDASDLLALVGCENRFTLANCQYLNPSKSREGGGLAHQCRSMSRLSLCRMGIRLDEACFE